MSVKKIVIKIVIGLIIVALLLAALFLLSRPEEKEAEPDITVFTSKADDISRIDIISEEGFTLVKRDDKWVMQGMEDVALVSNLAETLVRSLANVTSPMLVEQNSKELDKYGLDNPKLRIRLVFSDDEETFYLGDESGDYYYFRLESSNDVYIVSYDVVYLALAGKMSFLSKTVFTVNADDVTKIAYGDIVLERDGDGWQEKTPYNMPADANSVETMVMSQLSSVVAAEIMTEAVLPQRDTTIIVSREDGEDYLEVTKAQDGYRYVTRADSDYIYRVSTAALSFLDLSGFDIISLYIMTIDITTVTEIELVSPSDTTILSIEAPSSEAPVFYKNGEEADETNFRDFYQTLVSLQFKSEGSATGSAEYSITFTKEDGEVYKAEFVPMTESDYAVRLNGKGGFTVSKKSVTDLFGYIKNIKTVR